MSQHPVIREIEASYLPERPARLPPRRHRPGPHADQGRRQGARPGVRGRGDRPPRRRLSRLLHGAQDLLRRRRREDLPAAQHPYRQDRGGVQGPGPPRPPQLPARARRQGRPHQGRAARDRGRAAAKAAKAAARRRPPRPPPTAAAAASCIGPAADQPSTSKALGTWKSCGSPPSSGEEHAHHVEAEAAGRRPGERLRSEVQARGPDDLGALAAAHRLQGVAMLLAGPGAHLDEDADAAVVGDQVDLRLVALGLAPVAGEDAHAPRARGDRRPAASARWPACREVTARRAGRRRGSGSRSQTTGTSRPLWGMTRKSLQRQSFLQQATLPVAVATPQTKPVLAALVAGVVRGACLGAVAVAVL